VAAILLLTLQKTKPSSLAPKILDSKNNPDENLADLKRRLKEAVVRKKDGARC